MEENDQERQLIYSFLRSQGEEIQMAIRKYRGKQYVDLRLWFQSKHEKCFLPTRKGISFPLEKADELSKGTARLVKAAERMLNQP